MRRRESARGRQGGARWRLVAPAVVAVALVVVASAASAGFNQASGAPIHLGTNAEPTMIQVGDVNGDGKPDLVVLDLDNSSHPQLAVFFGAASAHFTTGPVTALNPTGGAGDFALANVNGDNHLDAVVTNYTADTISTFLGDGTGHFTQHGSDINMQSGSQPTEASVADLNGDGKPDLVVPNQFVAGIDLLEGDGSGGFSAFPGSPYSYSSSISLSDFADGPIGAVVGHFDADAARDVLVLNQYNSADQTHGTLMLFKGNGSGGVSLETTVNLPDVPGWFAECDLNGDGKLDIVVSLPGPDEVQAYLGNGDGTFSAQTPVSTPDPGDVVVGDFNGDGLPDVAAIDNAVADGAVDIVLGDGHGNLAAEPGGPFAIDAGTAPQFLWMQAGDVSGDHKADLLGINDAPGAVDVLLGQGGALPSGTVSPASGPSGSTVTVTGTNLNTVAFVQFGSVDGAITAHSATQLSVTVPAGAAAGKLLLIGANGSSQTSTSFTPATATITSFTPKGGGAGTSVVITGTAFTGATAVKFGATNAASFHVDSDTQITATTAVGTNTGTISVVGPAGTTTSATPFYGPPSIAGFTPSSGATRATVTLSGTNLTGATSVTLGATSCPFAATSLTSLTLTVPSGAANGTFTVTTPGGVATSVSSFTVTPPPAITSVSPGSGPIGTPVAITGTHLLGTVGVKIGSIIAVPTSVTATEVDFTVPPGAVTGRIVILNPAGSATSPGSFTVTG